ncbi:14286_t:CDS:2 [Gigaspora rosea]|nr:14286_t:CDS:2 [Gigaspora rosea]
MAYVSKIQDPEVLKGRNGVLNYINHTKKLFPGKLPFPPKDVYLKGYFTHKVQTGTISAKTLNQYYNNIRAYCIALGFGWNDDTFDTIKKEACDKLNKQDATLKMVLNELDELKKKSVEQVELVKMSVERIEQVLPRIIDALGMLRINIPDNIYSGINQFSASTSDAVSHSANDYLPSGYNTTETVPLPSFNRLAQRNIYSVSSIDIDPMISDLFYDSNSPS